MRDLNAILTDLCIYHRFYWDQAEYSLKWPRQCLHIKFVIANALIATLNRPRNISSTGASLNWPFFARPIGVLFAKVITTSLRFLEKIDRFICMMVRESLVYRTGTFNTNLQVVV